MFIETISDNKTGFENCMEIGKTYVAFLNNYSNYFKVMVYFESNDCKFVSLKINVRIFLKKITR